MNYPINKGQITAIHVAKTTIKLDEETYRGLIMQYTNGRSSSSKDMYWHEAKQLLDKLTGNNSEACIRQRRKLIGMAHTMGWEIANVADPMKPKADMNRINNWCVKFGLGHKPLNDYNEKELPKLLTQFEAVLKSHIQHGTKTKI